MLNTIFSPIGYSVCTCWVFAFLFHFIIVEGKSFLTFLFTFEFTIVVDSSYQMVKKFGDGICSQSGEHGVSLVGTFFEISPPLSVLQFNSVLQFKPSLTAMEAWQKNRGTHGS